MTAWELDVENSISTLWLESIAPNLVATYKSEAMGGWNTIGTMTDIGDDLYSIPMTFTSEGSFLVRVLDTNTGKYLIDKVEVKAIVDNQAVVTAIESLRRYVVDTNHKVSSLFKRWQKRGW